MNVLKAMRMVMVVSVAATLASSFHAEASDETAIRDDFVRARERIDELGKNGDIPGLMRLADETSGTWRARSMKYYGDLMLRICNVLRSDVSQKDIPFAEIHSVAQRTVDSDDPNAKDNISVETHFWLLGHLQEQTTYQKGTTSDEEWAAKRKAEGERWMVAWDRMEAAIDPNWDPRAPLPEVTPPAEAHLLPVPRVPAADVEDPALRAAYEDAIKENNLKIRHDFEQRQLARMKGLFTRTLVFSLGTAYCVGANGDAELEALLANLTFPIRPNGLPFFGG